MTTPSRVGRLRAAARVAGALARLARPGRPATLAAQIAAHARRTPQRLALRCGEARWTWRALDEDAGRRAGALAARGARRGETIALALGNTPETLISVAACARLGIAAAVLPNGIGGHALRHALAACAPRWVIVSDDARAAFATLPPALAPTLLAPADLRGDQIAPALPAADEATLLYLFTSGTTGLPKAARITVRRFRRFAAGFAFAICRLRRADVVYLALPLTHATGLLAAWGASVVAGATLALRPHFSASAFWSDCREVGATVVPYIGEICRYLVASPPQADERRHGVRLFYGAGLRADVWRALQARFAIPEIVEFYGSTEGNVGLVNLEGRPGMLGRLLPRQAVVRVDDGGTPVRDRRGHLLRVDPGASGLLIGRIDRANRFDGYTDADATAAKLLRDPFGDGHDWFSTGDLVRRHPGRWVSFVDRLGDTFRWKGENVSTTEVAEELLRCPGVAEAIVYGVEVAGCEGRAGMAAVVPTADFSPARLAAHVVAALPRHARPLFLRLLEAPDLTASFKYVKGRLQREAYDPRLVGDPLFRLDEARGDYAPLR
ncbi:AMP-binding protein [bacterium]|nr:AMP-binding protein [bacterium]